MSDAKRKLSDCIRPTVEAAPWVIEAVLELENKLAAAQEELNAERNRRFEGNRISSQEYNDCQKQLAASNAREAQLREAIQSAISWANGREDEWGERAINSFGFLHNAIALPQDDTALQIAIAAEREACAVVCEASRKGLEENEVVWREHSPK